MNRLLLHISKTLSLLAVIMLPVQQALATNCCCRSGHVNHTVAGSPSSCCSQSHATYCSTTDKSLGSCCDGQSHTGSKPCRCPVGLCGLDPPMAVDSASETTSSDEDLVIATIGEVSATVTDVERRPHRESLRLSASHASTSGSQLCVLLCRYRL